jgi:glutaredoxin
VRSLRRSVPLLALAVLLLGAVPPQKRAKDGVCPYCKDDPELLARAGLVSHGPIDIGPEGGSEGVAERLAVSDWLFLESEHLRWGSSLASETVKAKDRERLEAELDELRELFPDIPVKLKRLDPYLRLHLFAARGERFYARFQELLRVTDADFPEQRQNEGPYMGNGRFLGEKDKFEVLLHVNRATHQLFTSDHMGVTVTDSLRWHFQGLHKMFASIPAVDSDLRYDRALYPHTVHNLSHLFLCAYKHFSYDPPIWLDEGLAHAMEHEVDPRSHTSDGEEGSMPDNKGPADWDKELAGLRRKGDVTSFAELLHVQSFAQMEQDMHVSAYGLVQFLIEEHGEPFAAFLGAVKGQLDERGYPDGSDLRGLQRAALKEHFGWTPAELDEAFGAWIDGR